MSTTQIKCNQKVVFITGGGSGIGAATTDLFLKKGAKVISSDFSFPAVELSDVDFNLNPVKIPLDVRNQGQVSKVINMIVEKFGNLDVVINSAGIFKETSVFEISEDEWDNMMAVNAKGTFFVCQAALRYMIKQKNGSIVNISSESGLTGGEFSGAHYSASKAAVIGMTKSLAKLSAPYGVRVNSIAPGTISTPMISHLLTNSETIQKEIDENIPLKRLGVENIPLKRIGQPIEIANVICFLSSEEASYITGGCICVNGGTLMP
ncbi:SDR family NAD(P)-dependent oxidoreductase [Desulforhopalus singaporensis]|uniref:3-oxoacyl-[acyl-carrier protein] reductase n=1 Tax=Desulforhopalus singaporensis TaxID=91360 RepID=A0A1H0VV99_9BACT|nr:SDR family NAD(P)-dependent oxidoreductase [Desulforhopalus singaporensis]SDP82171.1 3-oxoacyl-[acyl-carrier protein] reductase [Desulforhopalus singaporensis]